MQCYGKLVTCFPFDLLRVDRLLLHLAHAKDYCLLLILVSVVS